MPLRVLYVISSLGRGGAEVQLLQSLRHMDRTRWDPTVCALGSPGPLTPRFEEEGIPVHHLGRKGRLDLGLAFRLRRVSGRIAPDLVHSHMLYSNLLVRLLYPTARGPAVISQDHGLSPWKGPLWTTVDRMTAHGVDLHVTVSERSRQLRLSRERFPPERTVVVHNAVDPVRFDPRRFEDGRMRGSRMILGTVASLKPVKAIPNLLRAMRLLRDRGRRPELRLVGDGPQRGELEMLSRDLGISDSVTFLGERDDIPMELAAVDLFVLPSIREDFPVSLLEAMAMERACVATDVGGVGEAISHGVSGWLVPPGSAEALAATLAEVMADPGRMHSVGLAARRTVLETFTVQRQVEQLMDLYDGVMRGG